MSELSIGTLRRGRALMCTTASVDAGECRAGAGLSGDLESEQEALSGRSHAPSLRTYRLIRSRYV